jgi:uncharacterized protein with FMN-binding domain
LKKYLGVFIVSLFLLITLVGCAKASESKWVDGQYEGSAEGLHGEVVMSVTVANGKITTIDVVSQSETEGISDLAFVNIPKEIIDEQSIEEIDTVAGATISSTAVIEAITSALTKAEK